MANSWGNSWGASTGGSLTPENITAIAEAVMESRIEASYDTTAAPAGTLRRRLRQMFNKVGL